MNRQDWEKSKKKMRSLLDQGIAELKELAAEASFMTDATSNVVKLEMDVHRLRTRLEKAQTRLGREVARSASGNGAIRATAGMRKLIKEIHQLEAAIQQDEKKIKRAPLSWSAARKAVTQKSRRRAATKRTTATAKRKTATRKKKAARKKSSAAGKRISKR